MSRIIAGSRGGRRITTPSGEGTRPTTDRVREALFSAIASWAGTASGPPDQGLAGLAFCDLYAGSGAVGLEAASRGASPVLLVEADRGTAAIAARNASVLELTAGVQAIRVEQLLRQPAMQPYDVIFADPPYEVSSATVDAQLRMLLDQGWLADAGLVVVERSRRTPPVTWPSGFGGTWSKRYGETTLSFGSSVKARSSKPEREAR